MYFVKYGNKYLHDPYSDKAIIFSPTSDCATNSSGDFTFKMGYEHPLYSSIITKDASNPVVIYSDNDEIFRGYIYNIVQDEKLVKTVRCKSNLSYLADSLVRPYSTIEGEAELHAPNKLSNLLVWYIDQHNKHVDLYKQFEIGINQLNLVDDTIVYRSSTVFPTTADEIYNKIVAYGGYLCYRYENGKNIIDYYAEYSNINTQIIELGKNILSIDKEQAADGIFNTVYATGGYPDETSTEPISLKDVVDGSYGEYVKIDDVLYYPPSVLRYGKIEYHYDNPDITTATGLLNASKKILANNSTETISFELKALDLSLVVKDYTHLKPAELVRIRVDVMNIDMFLIVTGISYDFEKPDNTMFIFGSVSPTLTKKLFDSINKNADAIGAMDTKVTTVYTVAETASAVATEASSTASSAATAASTAQSTADTAVSNAAAAQSTADTAVSNAATAQSTADTAVSNAAAAQSTADTAVSNAATAQSTADTAVSNAATAQSTADTAVSNAAAAQSTADTAVSNAAAAQSTADTAVSNAAAAQSTADTALSNAANAAKVATNYIEYDSVNGLVVGNMTDQILGPNTQICVENVSGTNKATVNLRDGTSVLAKFQNDLIELGKNSNSSEISLCDGEGKLSYGNKNIILSGKDLDGGQLDYSGATIGSFNTWCNSDAYSYAAFESGGDLSAHGQEHSRAKIYSEATVNINSQDASPSYKYAEIKAYVKEPTTSGGIEIQGGSYIDLTSDKIRLNSSNISILGKQLNNKFDLIYDTPGYYWGTGAISGTAPNPDPEDPSRAGRPYGELDAPVTDYDFLILCARFGASAGASNLTNARQTMILPVSEIEQWLISSQIDSGTKCHELTYIYPTAAPSWFINVAFGFTSSTMLYAKRRNYNNMAYWNINKIYGVKL